MKVSKDVRDLNPELETLFDGVPKTNKLGAVKTILDGIKFDSKGESNRYAELKLLEQAGEISDLKLQPKFILCESFRNNGRTYRGASYTADFMYEEGTWTVVEDFKGHWTEASIVRIKWFLQKYPYYKFKLSKRT